MARSVRRCSRSAGRRCCRARIIRGSASITATISNLAGLTTSNYDLAYDGTNWSMLDTASGVATALTASTTGGVDHAHRSRNDADCDGRATRRRSISGRADWQCGLGLEPADHRSIEDRGRRAAGQPARAAPTPAPPASAPPPCPTWQPGLEGITPSVSPAPRPTRSRTPAGPRWRAASIPPVRRLPSTVSASRFPVRLPPATALRSMTMPAAAATTATRCKLADDAQPARCSTAAPSRSATR